MFDGAIIIYHKYIYIMKLQEGSNGKCMTTKYTFIKTVFWWKYVFPFVKATLCILSLRKQNAVMAESRHLINSIWTYKEAIFWWYCITPFQVSKRPNSSWTQRCECLYKHRGKPITLLIYLQQIISAHKDPPFVDGTYIIDPVKEK